jgi:hypothetical protein
MIDPTQMMGGGAPPPDLSQIVGGPPPPPIGAPPDTGGGIPGQPDSPDVTDLINQAADLLQQALSQEKDPEDKALIADLIAKAHKFTGSQQKLIDQAVGAGPGAKVIRKATGGGGGGY